MATIHFYEKPGCMNNTRQKQALISAGHLLVVHNLLQQPWVEDKARLRSFFAEMPVADWFNRSAPAIKNGEISIDSLDEQQAIDLMVKDPLLIRRPLLEVGESRRAGFDAEQIALWLGVVVEAAAETCPKQQNQGACHS